jgi:succinoglycan biosynthesis transport protein ExoP
MDVASAMEHMEQSRDEAIDLPRLIVGVRRRRQWIYLSAIAAALLSSAFVFFASPRYTGVAKVLLEDQESYYTRPDKASGAESAATIDPEAVQSEAEAVMSPDLARKAIERLDLAANPEFAVSGGGGSSARADQRVVDKFLSRLTVFPAPKSRVLEIEFVSRDPGLAARAANTVAEVFLQSQEEAKAQTARAAGAWLLRKIEELRAKVADADAKVEAYRTEAGLIAGANGQTVPVEQLTDLNTQLANARSSLATANAKAALLRSLQQAGRLDDAPDSVADESMRRIADERVTMKAELAEASRTLLPMHPRIKALTAQLASLDDQIRAAAAKNVHGFENEARIAGDQVAALSAALVAQSKTVATGNADDVQLRALDMEAKTDREQLESYLQKYREAAAREADNAAPADARIIATAEPPRSPTFPKVWQTILLATLAAIVASSGVAAAAALAANEAGDAPSRDAGARAQEAPSAVPVAPGAGADSSVEPAPRHPEPGWTAARDDFETPAALAQRLAKLDPAHGAPFVLIAGHECGQALAIALETARKLSSLSATALIDLGATEGWLADVLEREGIDDAELVGLADLLAGRATFGEVIRRDLSSGLDIIPAGGDVIGVEGLDDIFAALASAYGLIVAHASDWRAATARIAAARADAVVIVSTPAKLKAAVHSARTTGGESYPEILAFSVKPAQPAFQEAA